MNIASIDIGSNTVLLLIANITKNNPSFETIKNLYRAPRLGRGLDSDGKISASSLNNFYSVLDEYSLEIKKHNCEKVIAVATAAMRKATNSDEIKKYVKDNYNIEINIIDGETEAYLSYIGAASILPECQNKVVIDIGGGSTEIIYGHDGEIIFRKSFPVGAVGLTERFVAGELVTDQELAELKDYSLELFAELTSHIPPTLPAIAVAGTPTSLSCMNLGLKNYIENEVEGSKISRNELYNLEGDLKLLTPQQRLDTYGEVVNGREDVILSGTVILSSLAEILKVDEYHVTGKGIRYGAVVDFLSKY